jgi:transcriptional regulator with XRE-family HTH domain
MLLKKEVQKMMLGERIKEHRKKQGFSQEKIAELVGTSRQAVTKWESGQSVPCMENLMALAEIFGLSLGELSSGVNDNSPVTDAADVTTQGTQKKSSLRLDIIFVLVAVFAMWSILRIPAYIGFSMVGFLLIIVQVAAVLFVPLYLLWLRPRRLRNEVKNEYSKDKTKVAIKVKISTGISASIVLFMGYLLCGHAFLFLHGMGQWPIVLLVFGLIVIAISAVSNSRKVMIGTVAGYVIGFVCGMLFNWDTYHPERGPGVYTNNNWLIWLAAFLLFIAIGVIWEIISRHRKTVSKKS